LEGHLTSCGVITVSADLFDEPPREEEDTKPYTPLQEIIYEVSATFSLAESQIANTS